MFSRRQCAVLASFALAISGVQGQYLVKKVYSAAGCTGTPIRTTVMASATMIGVSVNAINAAANNPSGTASCFRVNGSAMGVSMTDSGGTCAQSVFASADCTGSAVMTTSMWPSPPVALAIGACEASQGAYQTSECSATKPTGNGVVDQTCITTAQMAAARAFAMPACGSTCTGGPTSCATASAMWSTGTSTNSTGCAASCTGTDLANLKTMAMVSTGVIDCSCFAAQDSASSAPPSALALTPLVLLATATAAAATLIG
jgi:hypothetical protein